MLLLCCVRFEIHVDMTLSLWVFLNDGAGDVFIKQFSHWWQYRIWRYDFELSLSLLARQSSGRFECIWEWCTLKSPRIMQSSSESGCCIWASNPAAHLVAGGMCKLISFNSALIPIACCPSAVWIVWWYGIKLCRWLERLNHHHLSLLRYLHVSKYGWRRCNRM